MDSEISSETTATSGACRDIIVQRNFDSNTENLNNQTDEEKVAAAVVAATVASSTSTTSPNVEETTSDENNDSVQEHQQHQQSENVVGCVHYKRRAKFVVSITIFFKSCPKFFCLNHTYTRFILVD